MPPKNISTKQLKNKIAAVEKLAGKIKAQIIPIGTNKCLNTDLIIVILPPLSAPLALKNL
jgi:hypothetical protein